MKKHIGIVILAAVIVSILVLYMVSFSVRFNHSALVLTFGKISRQADEPGLQWKWPWQTVVTFDRRIRTYHRQPVMTQTRDKQTIVATVFVNWRINKEEVDLFFRSFNESGSDAESLVLEAEEKIEGWIAEASNSITEYNLNELVTLDSSRFKLAALEGPGTNNQSSMLKSLQETVQAGGGYGLEIVDVGFSQLGVPDSVTEKVFGRMISERTMVSMGLIAEGESKAESIRGEAESTATEIRAQALADAEKIRGEGDAQAAEFYKTFSANTEFANFLRKMQTLSKTLTNRTTWIVDTDSPAYQLLKVGPQIIIGDQQENKNREGNEDKKTIKD